MRSIYGQIHRFRSANDHSRPYAPGAELDGPAVTERPAVDGVDGIISNRPEPLAGLG